ncbi:MAG: endolytic transglycosylase MltG [bacterium]
MQRLFKNSIFAGVVLIVIIFLGYVLFLAAPHSFAPETIFTVEQGKSLRSLSLALKDSHLIKSRVAFEAFVIAYEGEKHIVPGDYLFDNKLPVFEVARRISRGDHHLPPVKVTIPEGFTDADAAAAFAAKLPNFNQSNFFTLAKGKEGFLFPDTYFFLNTNTETEVIALMSENYEKKVAPLRPQIAATGHAENEIITMASLIEGEAKGDADRAVISGILWQRIKNGMMLQVDTDPETYHMKGLPAHPVSNPGLEAIKAAMYPTASPYLFYLHDDSGTIHYAKTFTEHKANKAKYLK